MVSASRACKIITFLKVAFVMLFYVQNVSQGFRTLKVNPLSINPTKWSNTLKQLVGNLPTNCLSVFDYLMKLALKGLWHNAKFWESFWFLRNWNKLLYICFPIICQQYWNITLKKKKINLRVCLPIKKIF